MPAPLPFRLPRTCGEFVYALVVLGLVCGMVLCLPLWSTERAFPHLPVWKWCPPLPAPADAVLLWGTVLAALLSIFSPRLTWAAAGGCLLLALQDQMRWQPWFFQYGLMLTLAALMRDRNAPAWLCVCRFIVIALYAWGGLHKLAPAYAAMYEATFTVPLTETWPAWAAALVKHSAPAGPWLEMAMALALCFARTRRAGVVAAVAAHLWILLLIGPLGTHYNHVVWPWNLIMIALVPLLFWRTPELGWKRLAGASQWIAAGLVLLLCGFMPGFSRMEKWDRYLSFQLYSGSERRLFLVASPQAVAAMPEAWRKELTPSASPDFPGWMELHFLQWSLRELNVPPPGDGRHLLALARRCLDMEFARRGEIIFITDFPFRSDLGMDVFTMREIERMRAIPELRRRKQ
jgi:hypothetical protein